MFPVWLDWPNRHKKPKAFTVVWPNSQKAKTQSGPHLRLGIYYRERQTHLKKGKTKCKASGEKREGAKQHGNMFGMGCVYHMLTHRHTSFHVNYNFDLLIHTCLSYICIFLFLENLRNSIFVSLSYHSKDQRLLLSSFVCIVFSPFFNQTDQRRRIHH